MAPEFFRAQLTGEPERGFPGRGVVRLVVVMQLALGPEGLMTLSGLFVFTVKQFQVVPAKAHMTPELVFLGERFIALRTPDVTWNPMTCLPMVLHRCLLIVCHTYSHHGHNNDGSSRGETACSVSRRLTCS